MLVFFFKKWKCWRLALWQIRHCVYIFLSVFSPYSSSVRKYKGRYSKKSGSETNRDTREGIEKRREHRERNNDRLLEN